MPGVVVRALGLRKAYGSAVAVAGISIEVHEREIYGIVGPNGAGKTTMMECLEGLRSADEGEIRVLGLDPRTEGLALRERIGVQLQDSALPARLRVGEALRLFASFYGHPVQQATLLADLGLTARVDTAWGALSGGQQQRLAIALALVGDPDLVFFDELTTGLDPRARHATWDLVREVRERGKTVVLTTHFMEEAERLCDRVMIIDEGRVVAVGTPEELIRSLGAEQTVTFIGERADADLVSRLEALPRVVRVTRSGDRIMVHGESDGVVGMVLGVLDGQGVAFHDLRTEKPSLEDVFLALTGRRMAESGP